MNKFFFAIFFLICAEQSFAMCGSTSISVWPNTKIISPNAIFIVEGYMMSQAVIRNLNKKHRIYLSSEHSIIPLQVINTYKSQYNLTQAVLQPASQLIPGTTYTLHIDSLDSYEQEVFDRNSFRWKAGSKADNNLPAWQRLPQLLSKEKIAYGCGPASYVNFCVCIRDESPVVVLSKVKAVKTGEITEYLLSPDSNLLHVGHDMCAGEFDFEDGELYEITFSLMDASGNKDNISTKTIQFSAPSEKDSKTNKKQADCECPEQGTKNNQLWLIAGIALVASIIIILFIYSRNQRQKAG